MLFNECISSSCQASMLKRCCCDVYRRQLWESVLKRTHIKVPTSMLLILWMLCMYRRGNFTNVLRYFPTQAFNFAFKGES
jgi:hypothetical protein